MNSRPSVSVVVPFTGTDAELDVLIGRLRALSRTGDDELIVADNRVHAHAPGASAYKRTSGSLKRQPSNSTREVTIVPAPQIRTPAFARNAGALRARGEWLLFIDADTVPAPSLMTDYFDQPPKDDTAVLAGAITDTAGPTLAARYAVARSHLSQVTTLHRPVWPYAQTANCAVRRAAFEQVGGFHETARAGEDADLCFRLSQAGWGIEERARAVVEHHSRDTLVALLAQLARHGSGSAWCNRRHPGSFPPQSKRSLVKRIVRSAARAAKSVAANERDTAAFDALDLLGACAFELGRLLPNDRR